ncbi:MAG: hypothetical protein A2161_04915 [Candidatus Schekmanbacteria bacterium RBG_13_48_7]|uniref:Aspartate/glutamate/uridylate kinase domain-containing protein n=1 Tax=Candidatus Schekmanbacteria bacterium RBG_13_48_7 TaxID=1817878 RepID=A0A1F7RLJ2_9BACT|nr:MAG: hypothetical protein A2161_04915 [Candidatus Schekmanbacteria bacterium RBG_13_48_7]
MLLIKIGSGKTINWDGVCHDVASLIEKEKIIIVHGANAYRDELASNYPSPLKRLNHHPEFQVFTQMWKRLMYF